MKKKEKPCLEERRREGEKRKEMENVFFENNQDIRLYFSSRLIFFPNPILERKHTPQ